MIKTRIKIVQSECKMECWPQIKVLFWWQDISATNSVCVNASFNLEKGTEAWAKDVIDRYLRLVNSVLEQEEKGRLHKKTKKISYMDYP